MGMSLRLVLLLIGVVIIAVILFDGIRRVKSHVKSSTPSLTPKNSKIELEADPLFDEIEHEERIEPILDESKPFETNHLTPYPYDEENSAVAIQKKGLDSQLPSNKIIIVNIMAVLGKQFDGPNVLQALLSIGFRHGDMSIFHYYDSGEANTILFSIASAVEPGTFDLASIGTFLTPGLSLFMSTSGSGDPLKTFELMIEFADRLADRLGGEVLDAGHNPLSADKIESLRLEIGNFSRLVKQHSSHLLDGSV